MRAVQPGDPHALGYTHRAQGLTRKEVHYLPPVPAFRLRRVLSGHFTDKATEVK